MQIISKEATEKRLLFFDALFGNLEGFFCLAAKAPTRDKLEEEFYRWPEQKELIADFIQTFVMTHNIYYCSTLMSEPKRSKENAVRSWTAWADLDACSPSHLEEQATFVIESSPNRFQALWKFEEPVDAFDAEDISRRLAYKYLEFGADKSGWDLTQLLRVPFTFNHKYSTISQQGPQIKIVQVNPVQYVLETLKTELPQVASYDIGEIPMPDAADLPDVDPEQILQLYAKRLQPIAFHLFSTEPEQKSWSESLWQMLMFLFEAGMSLEEAFVVARASACNKFKRDGRSEVQLWKDVCRAKGKSDFNLSIMSQHTEMLPLLSDGDRKAAEAEITFVEDYIDWAKNVGDAAPQYHQAGAFMLLSSLLSGPIRLPTSFGTFIPNLWFMLLADTTLTRKTTAMDLSMDMLIELDADALMATDGSIEGLFSTLAGRSSRPSVFLRDEFSGLLESMVKKDYYAGMAEMFTKLYDGKFQKKILRRETVEVRDPILLIFAGGIRERILQLLTHEHIMSGFLPRFIFITAESDIARLKPLGPPTETTSARRNELMQRVANLHTQYTSPQMVTVNGKILPMPSKWEASLDTATWNLYNHYETEMTKAALATDARDLYMPMFDRLSKSGLKCAVLLAALRGEDRIVVNETDLTKAFSYVEYWRTCAMEVISNVGRTSSERVIQQIMKHISREDGVTRSLLMQRFHLNSRDAETILMTLEQRGMVNRVKAGRTERLYPISPGMTV